MTRAELREFVRGKASVAVQEKSMKLKGQDVSFFTANDACQYRDYLMLMLLIASAQRPGAGSNLTLSEYKNREYHVVHGKNVYRTSTLIHKTSSTKGPANLFGNEKRKTLGDMSLKKLRPKLACGEEQGRLPDEPGM